MGHQESPPPHQRHRMPHHRRPRHHHDHDWTAQTTNGKSALSLGRLNRECHAPDSQNVVESWLGQLTAPVSTSWLVSPEAQNHLIHRRERQRSQDGHILPCSRSPGRVDPLWRPQHIPPAQGSSPPRFPRPTNRDKKVKRYKRNSGDSSLISDLVARKEPRGIGYTITNSEHDESSCHKPLYDAEVGTAGTSSPLSHKSTSSAFKKRPRHKTKVDKYDTKKSEVRKRRREDERPRRSKSKKRRPILTGKNVMKNFASEAVLNDRITVQANLKPGLFGNKRVPKEKLVTDLSFSEMPFPTHQEREVPQQKGLSNSRLKERRRESRELEQISSFFLPPRTNVTQHKERPAKLMYPKETCSKRLYDRDNTTSGFYQDSFATPSSPASLATHRQQSSISWQNRHLLPRFTPSNPDCRPSSSRTTAYYTWPDSQDSHEATPPKSMEPERSTTPESIRKALTATGVYADTGIYSYDVSNNQQNRSLAVNSESSSTPNKMIHHVKTYEGDDSSMNLRCSNGTGVEVPLLAYLEARWNTILPPEWRTRGSSKAVYLDITTDSGPLTRQEIVKQARIKPTQDFHKDRHVSHHQDHYSGASPHFAATRPIPLPPEADQGRATISSRDAMPPPPILPYRLDSLHSSSFKPAEDSNSSIPLEPARLVVPHGQIPNRENTQATDKDRATGQPHESSRESEKVVPTLDSASWIPQAVTSGIASYERDKTLSRLSMRSPIYEVQSIGRESEGTLAPTQLPATSKAETMADFIMRIESELEESAPIDEYCQPEPNMKSGQFSIEAMTSDNETQHRQLTALDGPQIGRHQVAIRSPSM